LRLRTYDKLQNLVREGQVKKIGKKHKGRDHSILPLSVEGIAREGFSTKLGRILVFDRRALPREISIVRTESIEFGEEN
jgi:hypothetical protein